MPEKFRQYLHEREKFLVESQYHYDHIDYQPVHLIIYLVHILDLHVMKSYVFYIR